MRGAEFMSSECISQWAEFTPGYGPVDISGRWASCMDKNHRRMRCASCGEPLYDHRQPVVRCSTMEHYHMRCLLTVALESDQVSPKLTPPRTRFRPKVEVDPVPPAPIDIPGTVVLDLIASLKDLTSLLRVLAPKKEPLVDTDPDTGLPR